MRFAFAFAFALAACGELEPVEADAGPDVEADAGPEPTGRCVLSCFYTTSERRRLDWYQAPEEPQMTCCDCRNYARTVPLLEVCPNAIAGVPIEDGALCECEGLPTPGS